jgi:hypothetical protein
MQAYTDPVLLDVRGAVERLPIPYLPETQGEMVSVTGLEPVTPSLSSPMACAQPTCWQALIGF